MITLYKLTDQKGNTQNNTHWEIGATQTMHHTENPKLCSPDVLHAYTNISLGLLINPIQADINNPRIFKCKGNVVVSDWGKVGVFELTPTQEINLPIWYTNPDLRKQVSVWFAILCAESVLSIFENYDSSDSRPREAIEAAKNYLKNPYAAEAAALTIKDFEKLADKAVKLGSK